MNQFVSWETYASAPKDFEFIKEPSIWHTVLNIQGAQIQSQQFKTQQFLIKLSVNVKHLRGFVSGYEEELKTHDQNLAAFKREVGQRIIKLKREDVRVDNPAIKSMALEYARIQNKRTLCQRWLDFGYEKLNQQVDLGNKLQNILNVSAVLSETHEIQKELSRVLGPNERTLSTMQKEEKSMASLFDSLNEQVKQYDGLQDDATINAMDSSRMPNIKASIYESEFMAFIKEAMDQAQQQKDQESLRQADSLPDAEVRAPVNPAAGNERSASSTTTHHRFIMEGMDRV